MTDPLDDTLALLGAFTRTIERIKSAHAGEVAGLMQDLLVERTRRSKAEDAVIAVGPRPRMTREQATALAMKRSGAADHGFYLSPWVVDVILEAANGSES